VEQNEYVNLGLFGNRKTKWNKNGG